MGPAHLAAVDPIIVAAWLLAACTAAAGPATERMFWQGDAAGANVHAQANADLLASGDGRARVVLIGDSITWHWQPQWLPSLDGTLLVNRGIAGQSSSQMLLRFEDDVIALAPVAVVILAGTNDLRVDAGTLADAAPGILARIRRNITAMADIAAANGVTVIISAIPPIVPALQGERRDPQTLAAANRWLQAFAERRGYAFADYRVLADSQGFLRETLTADGLHPNAEAYRLMQPVLAAAITRAGLPR